MPELRICEKGHILTSDKRKFPSTEKHCPKCGRGHNVQSA